MKVDAFTIVYNSPIKIEEDSWTFYGKVQAGRIKRADTIRGDH